MSDAKPEAASIDVTSPDFQKAVAAAVAAQMETITASLAMKVAAQQSAPGDTLGVLSSLTQMIAEMTNTGANRKTVTPEESRKRLEASRQMGELLQRVQDEGLRPHYIVRGQTWLEGQMIQPQVPIADGKWKDNEIIWMGPPNTALEPKNDIAKQIMKLYEVSIGGSLQIEGATEQAVWTTFGGLIMVGDNAPQTLESKGHVQRQHGSSLEDATRTTTQLVSTDDRNATAIPILGKTFPPAEVTAPGSIPKLSMPASN